ncbi:hypothetical protein, partial [Shewanella sp.]|uniref:hypothetical protein n=1 Tax=Shewanella sp. TaxID=50422 RepID=UPI001EBCD927
KLYYPEGYMPELLTEWPADRDIVLPAEQLPDSLRKGMNTKQEYVDRMREHHGLDRKSVTRPTESQDGAGNDNK